ncbi:MAG: Gfo/Idh/MocA family oxidoreductase [Oscillospiraceae bacterium]|nr:Gfo/Idh/MocA family oxidoreductase [Oscillospiraceae bacterium]MBR6738546.1 Gfo/Idh/MocA family oxidoreductase [Oscillospiraceae bacterium]
MKKLRFATLSAMGIARSHIKGIIENPETCELVAFSDVDPERIEAQLAWLEETLGHKPDVRTYTDYRELLACDDIDAVVVTAADQAHCEMSLAALAAGKHVLCEKPMTLSLDECRQMVEAANASDRKFMVGQVCRYAPGFVKAHELVKSGAIGELFFVESEYAHDYSKIPGHGGWRLDPRRHGFLGGGCHAVDLLRWIAGDPYEVYALANRKMLSTWPTDDCTVAVMKFPNDVIGKVFVSTGCKRNYTMRSVFYGSRGTIICDNTSPEITLFSVDHEEGHTKPTMIPIEINNHNMTAEIREFTDCIINDLPIKTTVLEGAKTVAAALACVESSKTGVPVAVKYDF